MLRTDLSSKGIPTYYVLLCAFCTMGMSWTNVGGGGGGGGDGGGADVHRKRTEVLCVKTRNR